MNGTEFAKDARALAEMLRYVADQAEQGGCCCDYYQEAYPPMVAQIGKVLSHLGQCKLVK